METTTQTQQYGTDVRLRRRWRRYHIDVSLRATVRSGDLVKTVHGRGTDLGQGGLAAYIAIELSLDDVVDLQITLPYSSTPITVKAMVRNRNSYCYGMEFLNITPAQQNEIERCCRSLELTQ
jgi:c-di-GMP-binding flagellar brake protein YcgR